MMRDKRVRTSAFFGPIFMIVLLLCLFGFLLGAVGKPENQRIHVVRAENSIVKGLQGAKVNVEFVDSVEAGKQLVREGKARLVLDFGQDFDARLQSGQRTEMRAFFNPDQPTGQIALAVVNELVAKVNRAALETVLAQRQIPIGSTEPLQLVREPVQVGKRQTSEMLIGILPYLIVIWAFFGGMSIVSDMVAGEKEKATLETLLISPVKRSQIALGKFLALSVVCLLSSLSSVVGLVAMAALNLPITKPVFEQGFGLSAVSLGTILLVLIPTVGLFASVMLAVSAYARNVREAQTHLTLVSFLVMMPAIFSQFIGFTDFGASRAVDFVPILNTANTIRQALLGKVDGVGLAITVLISVVLALIAMAISIRLFSREEVLVRV